MLEAVGATFEINRRRLVDAVDLELRSGRIVALVGPNGAGKSTLLRLFAGEIAATAGAVRIDGRDLRQIPAAELARRRAVVPQSPMLSFPFTVLEIVLIGASVPGFEITDPHTERSALAAIDAVGLEGFEERLFTELSGGERQRVHVARALCQLATSNRPRDETSVLLLDEPTASLDFAHQSIVLGEARRQAEAGRTVLVVLHDLNLAATYADEIVLMSRGRVAAAGKPQAVLTDELLSEIYRHPVRTNTTPPAGRPFVLPQI
jgi:iron complex transport system ATP-binding protein